MVTSKFGNIDLFAGAVCQANFAGSVVQSRNTAHSNVEAEIASIWSSTDRRTAMFDYSNGIDNFLNQRMG